jgi:hypothetical protein
LNLSATVQPRLAARMLAAALIESMDWWFDHESIAARGNRYRLSFAGANGVR